MKRALFLMILSCLAASPVVAQKAAEVTPKTYKVGGVDTSGSVSPDGRFLTYADWDTDELFIRDLKTGENRRLTGEVNSYKVSRDGKQLAYGWANEDGSYLLRLIGIDGSGARILSRSDGIPWMELQDWSPNGKHILAVVSKKGGAHEVQLISAADGSVQVLQNLPDWRFPLKMRFSPDGRYIAYDLPQQEGSPSRDIFVISPNASREGPLVQHSANDLLLDWTPDGDRILFASDRTGTLDVLVIQVADGKPRGSPRLVRPNIAPNGAMVAMGFAGDGSYYYGLYAWENDVYLATLDPARGTLRAPQKLVSHVGFDTSVEWSPGGQYLAYVWGHGRKAAPFTLAIRSVETGKERRLRINQMMRLGDREFQPHWSPDGRSFIALGRDLKLRLGLYRIDAQTGTVAPLVVDENCPVYMDCVSWPVWSPQRNVIFVRWSNKGRSLVARDLETSRERDFYHAVSRDDHISHLAISPDGRRLAFVRWDAKQRTTSLEVVSTSGGEPRRLLELSPRELAAYWHLPFASAWTPDSRHIVYATSTEGRKNKFEFWQISAEGGEPQNLELAMEGLLPYGLSVHPDGRRIAFTAGTAKRDEVWVLENFLPAEKTGKQ